MGLLVGDESMHEMERVMVRFQVVCFFPNETFLGGPLSAHKEPGIILSRVASGKRKPGDCLLPEPLPVLVFC